MLANLILGLSVGLSSGLSPGPLLTLVISASLQRGFRGGLQVALAPLVSDFFIVSLSILVIGNLPPSVLRWVGTIGALVVFWLGFETIRSGRTATLEAGEEPKEGGRQDLWRGVIVNLLNPHPYLFWATIGGPTLVNGWRTSPGYALAFLVPFYVALVGSKVALAWLVGSQSGRLSETWYRRLLMGCGVLLLGMGGLLLWQMWFAGQAPA